MRSVRGLKSTRTRTAGYSTRKKTLDTVIRGLARNKQKFGEQYFPCRLRSGDSEKDRAIIYPYIYQRDEIAKDGHCHCLLYYRKDAAETLTGEIK